MAAPHRLKINQEVSVKAGADCVIINDSFHAVLIFHDEIDELCELLQKLKEKKQ